MVRTYHNWTIYGKLALHHTVLVVEIRLRHFKRRYHSESFYAKLSSSFSTSNTVRLCLALLVPNHLLQRDLVYQQSISHMPVLQFRAQRDHGPSRLT